MLNTVIKYFILAGSWNLLSLSEHTNLVLLSTQLKKYTLHIFQRELGTGFLRGWRCKINSPLPRSTSLSGSVIHDADILSPSYFTSKPRTHGKPYSNYRGISSFLEERTAVTRNNTINHQAIKQPFVLTKHCLLKEHTILFQLSLLNYYQPPE